MSTSLYITIESNGNELERIPYHYFFWEFHWYIDFFTKGVQSKIQELAKSTIWFDFVNWRLENLSVSSPPLNPEKIIESIKIIKLILSKYPDEFSYFYDYESDPSTCENNNNLYPAPDGSDEFHVIIDGNEYSFWIDYDRCELFRRTDMMDEVHIDIKCETQLNWLIKLLNSGEKKTIKINIIKRTPIDFFSNYFDTLLKLCEKAKELNGCIHFYYS